MSPRKDVPEEPALEGPDYVTLVIEWDSLADEIEGGMSGASSTDMPTKNSDWIVDEASRESFPASDPPAWGSSHAAAEPPELEETTPVKRRFSKKRVLMGVVGLFTLTGILAGIKWMRDR